MEVTGQLCGQSWSSSTQEKEGFVSVEFRYSECEFRGVNGGCM